MSNVVWKSEDDPHDPWWRALLSEDTLIKLYELEADKEAHRREVHEASERARLKTEKARKS